MTYHLTHTDTRLLCRQATRVSPAGHPCFAQVGPIRILYWVASISIAAVERGLVHFER